MKTQKMLRGNFVGLRVSDDELRTIDELARRLERKRGDAVRFVIRQAARELEANDMRAGAGAMQNAIAN